MYSFSVEPQPAALVMMASKSSERNASKFVRARSRATSRTPACAASAPQQACAAGTTTSQPLACSTRMVARFNSLNVTCATHPAKNATRARRWPCARKRLAQLAEEKFGVNLRQRAFRGLAIRAGAEFPCRARRPLVPSAGKSSGRAPLQRFCRGREAGGGRQNRAATRETNGRLYFCSICARASSRIFPYSTPEGQTVSQCAAIEAAVNVQ